MFLKVFLRFMAICEFFFAIYTAAATQEYNRATYILSLAIFSWQVSNSFETK